jgi:hypothetical protein
VAARYVQNDDGAVAASAWRLLLKLNPAGMTLVDRVPVQVVALPVDRDPADAYEPAERYGTEYRPAPSTVEAA